MRMPNEEQVERVLTHANIAMFSEGGDRVEISGPGGRTRLTRR